MDQSGELNGENVLALAEWVWCSFRAGQEITSECRLQEATKIMRRCDTDENGKVGREEFGEYYETTCAEMFR